MRRATRMMMIGAALAGGMACGCASFHAAPAGGEGAGMNRAAEHAPIRWPVRSRTYAEEEAARTPAVISRYRIDAASTLSDLSETELSLLVDTPATVLYAGVHGEGLVRVFRAGASAQRPGGEYLQFTSRPMSNDHPTDMWQIGMSLSWITSSIYRLRSGTHLVPQFDNASVLFDGLWAQVHEPAAGSDGKARPPRGILVHLGGTGSRAFEEPVIDRLREDGWLVLHVEDTRVVGAYSLMFGQRDELEERSPRRSPRNGDLFLLEPTDEPPLPGVPVTRETIEPVAGRLARTVDEVIAEAAYAVEGMLEYLESRRPGIKELPVVVAGYSAGGIAAPAVAARIGPRVRAVVLVGAGENLLAIARRSEFTDSGLRVTWRDGQPDSAAIAKLDEAYLARTYLDPASTAENLRGVPVLMVHANLDAIVPSDTGTALWERLGRPDRLTVTGGHMLMFWTMPMRAGTIARWIDQAVPRTEDGDR